MDLFFQWRTYCITVRGVSVFVPLIFYLILFALSVHFSVPLRSHQINAYEELQRMSSVKSKETILLSVIEKEKNSKDDLSDKHISPTELLASIFTKVDKDDDKLVSVEELSEYINLQTQKHINQAMKENYGLFMSIDKDPANGVITWAEYHRYFLLQNGIQEDYVDQHNEHHQDLQRSVKELIARDKASWSEAAHTDPDSLTLNEFLAFKHPESSHTTILALVDELLDKLDQDGDEVLTEEEFARLQVGDGGEGLLSQGEVERREEFRMVLDADGDGKADRKELLMYIDPKNPRHAREEAETLVALSDTDHDGKLSLSEVLGKMDLFLGSKMVDTARSFHDEF